MKLGRVLALALALPLGSADAQEGSPAQPPGELDVIPQPRREQVLVTPSRQERPESRVPQSTSVVGPERIREQAPPTAPDALEGEVGVVIQKTNLGGGSPVIRGRSGKDNLLLIDGQRFQNSTFRRNHQYLNTIDLGAVERMEVVRGPTSVLYGSDAMGGAINVITRRRELTGESGWAGRSALQYESAAHALIARASADFEVSDWGVSVGATSRRFDDLRAGSVADPIGAVDIDGVQNPTGYREGDFDLSVIHRLSETDSVDFLLLDSRQEHVPRSDVLIANDEEPDPPDRVRDTDPQRLRWYQLRYRHERPASTLESLVVTASLNHPLEERRRVRWSNLEEEVVEEDELVIPGLSAQTGIRYRPDHLLTAGLEAYPERIDSSRYTRDLVSGARTPEPGRFPDGATYQSYGTFLQDEWQIGDSLTWTNGARYSVFRVAADFEGLVVGTLPPFGKLRETFGDVTFASGLSVQLDESASVYGSLSRGFRAPNLDDMAVLGDFAAGDRVPNFDLDPEQVWNVEIGGRYASPGARAGLTAALAFYDDLLQNQFLWSDGGTDFFQVANVGRATIFSLEGWIERVLRPGDGQRPEHLVFANAFWNLGRNHSDDEPVSKVPPPEATLGYRIRGARDAWFAQADVRGAARQSRLAAIDRADPRFPENGTPAWWSFSVRVGIDVANGLRLTTALENVFDYRYRVHGSGIDAAGRNAVVALDWSF